MVLRHGEDFDVLVAAGYGIEVEVGYHDRLLGSAVR